MELLCNDCQRASHVQYHVVGQKCPSEGCGSYNTRRVNLLRHPQVEFGYSMGTLADAHRASVPVNLLPDLNLENPTQL